MPIALIWAQAQNGVIGRGGSIPWHLPEDLAHFRELTTGGTVVMGRVTWESLPERYRPLPRRRNIVLSTNDGWRAEDAEVATSWAEARQMCGASVDESATAGDTLWVIGGEALYRRALPDAERLEITVVGGDWIGDRHAPALGPEWVRVDAGAASTDWLTSSSGLRYRFESYHRAYGRR